jgi:hypothetical protein
VFFFDKLNLWGDIMKIRKIGSLVFFVVAMVAVTQTFGAVKSQAAIQATGCLPGTCVQVPWVVDCSSGSVNGPVALPSETWHAMLQNGASLGTTSVRCWCNNTLSSTYPNDTIEPDGTHWTQVKYMTWNGQTSSCRSGEGSGVELDPSTCQTGNEQATGFFYVKSDPYLAMNP